MFTTVNLLLVALFVGLGVGFGYFARVRLGSPASSAGAIIFGAFIALICAAGNDLPLWTHYSRSEGRTPTSAYIGRRQWEQMTAPDRWRWRVTAGGLMFVAVASAGCGGVWLARRTA